MARFMPAYKRAFEQVLHWPEHEDVRVTRGCRTRREAPGVGELGTARVWNIQQFPKKAESGNVTQGDASLITKESLPSLTRKAPQPVRGESSTVWIACGFSELLPLDIVKKCNIMFKT